MQFDHLGVIVRSIAKSRPRLLEILGICECSQEFEDRLNGVRLQFARDRSGMCYELLEPLGEDSPVYAALRKRSAILNHVAYRVGDLAAAGVKLCGEGCAPAGPPRSAIAYRGRRIQFFVAPENFMIELIEAPDHEHAFVPAPPMNPPAG